jgi:hypothetical protein
MTVKELISQLKKLDEDTIVVSNIKDGTYLEAKSLDMIPVFQDTEAKNKAFYHQNVAHKYLKDKKKKLKVLRIS